MARVSVTIFPVGPDGRPLGGREVERPCSACAGNYCQPGWCVDGIETEWIPNAPECNFANANGRTLLASLGIDPGPGETPCGALEPFELASLIEVCEQALGSTVEGLMLRAPMLREQVESRGAHGCRVHVMGSGDESAQRRVRELLEVLRYAHERGIGVAWG